MKKYAVTLWLTFLFAIIAVLFWRNEFVYSLPTPVPQNYKPVHNGTSIALPASLAAHKNLPVFLHFFNPDCPCSRFNIQHFKSLTEEYGNQVNFAVVLMTKKNYTALDIQKRFGLSIPVITDSTLAKTCGVYSTPQAVILDPQQQLYYRGNYNRSRYCTDKKTNYAQQALEALLTRTNTLPADQWAYTAYGCQLPTCTK